MAVSDRVIEGLKEFAEDLELGERIMVTIVEKCSCNPEGTDANQVHHKSATGHAQCHVCNDRGWIFTVKTYLPPLEKCSIEDE